MKASLPKMSAHLGLSRLHASYGQSEYLAQVWQPNIASSLLLVRRRSVNNMRLSNFLQLEKFPNFIDVDKFSFDILMDSMAE